MPALHAVQKELGHLDNECIKTLAKSFNISNAEVIDVITYYDDFRLEKEGQFKFVRRKHVKVWGVEHYWIP